MQTSAGRKYPKHQIEALQQQLQALQVQAQALQQQNQALLLQHALATSCCEVLHAMRTGEGLHRSWVCPSSGLLAEELPLLLDLGFQVDLSLLMQLAEEETQQLLAAHDQQQQQQQQQETARPQRRSTRSRSSAAAAASAAPSASSKASQQSMCWWPAGGSAAAATAATGGPTQQLPAAPHSSQQLQYLVPGELLAPLKHTLSNPPYPGAQLLTLEQLVSYYKALTKELTFLLSLLDQHKERGEDMCTDGAQLLLQLRELLLTHCSFVISILLLNPDDLLHKMRVVNMETLELSDTPEQCHKRMCWLVSKLELSAEQEEALVAGGRLFKRLLDKVRAERQQHLAAQQAQAAERLGSGRAVDLQAQQDMVRRLQVLVRKELLLLSFASAFVSSILTTYQVAQTAVLTWPWSPHLGMLAGILEAQHASAECEKQQQQQQQQQQQAVAPSPAQSERVLPTVQEQQQSL